MDIQTQKELVALTSAFYAAQAESFSDTRHSAWPGWERVAQLMGSHCVDGALRVLDVGCGNMRFEKFLSEALPKRELTFETIDNCSALVNERLLAGHINHHELDIISALIENKVPWGADIAPVDVACAFGVMHHVSGAEHRAALLGAMLGSVRSGGLVVVSLWRFMDVPTLAEKARETLVAAKADADLPEKLRGQLDELANQGDYLLGWQNKPGTYRYCHSFGDADRDTLIASVADKATLIERFRADGRTGDANEYLVFQKIS